ncbi:PIN-like domain-containing protein [Jiangella anatolica]|uniref:PIN-like domain-containing protein n=1 Tax=Jiangella anatolica TaxID=2670374 RepID=UPI0011B72B8E|nr:PIN domain-containing protein [Jiangella anatolica]
MISWISWRILAVTFEGASTLRKEFWEYYPPSERELEILWRDGTIILDANVLLHLHRYGKKTRDEFVNALTRNSERLWIPYQVALEYQRNRLGVVHSQLDAYSKIEGLITESVENVSKGFAALKAHPVTEGPYLARFRRSVKALLDGISQQQSEHRDQLRGGIADDEVWRAVSDLYEGRVGPANTEEKLRRIYEEGAARYDEKVPPGYLDAGKEEPDRYGDLVVWKQILESVSADPRPVIFVTDDAKEDWWNRVHGKTTGARVELLREFAEASGGHRIHFYRPGEFLRRSGERLDANVSKSAIEEIRSVSKSEEDHASLLSREYNDLVARLGEARRDAEQYDHEISYLMGQISALDLDVDRLTSDAREANARLGSASQLAEDARSETEVKAAINMRSLAKHNLNERQVALSEAVDRRDRLRERLLFLQSRRTGLASDEIERLQARRRVLEQRLRRR